MKPFFSTIIFVFSFTECANTSEAANVKNEVFVSLLNSFRLMKHTRWTIWTVCTRTARCFSISTIHTSYTLFTVYRRSEHTATLLVHTHRTIEARIFLVLKQSFVTFSKKKKKQPNNMSTLCDCSLVMNSYRTTAWLRRVFDFNTLAFHIHTKLTIFAAKKNNNNHKTA